MRLNCNPIKMGKGGVCNPGRQPRSLRGFFNYLLEKLLFRTINRKVCSRIKRKISH